MISEVFNEDCVEGMKRFPDKYFDLAVVDPPYGVGKFTCEARTNRNGKREKNKKSYSDNYEWNESILMQEYFEQLVRVSKERIIWGANYYNCFENGNGALVWYKGDMTETISHCEIASLSFQTKVSYVYINWQSGFYRKIAEGQQIHPCQKPVALYSWLFNKYATADMKILDTHLGSGSSRIAAHKAGLDFTAFELDKEYFDAQEKRYKQFTDQLVLCL